MRGVPLSMAALTTAKALSYPPLEGPWRGRVGSDRARRDTRRGGVSRGGGRAADEQSPHPSIYVKAALCRKWSTLPLQGRVRFFAAIDSFICDRPALQGPLQGRVSKRCGNARFIGDRPAASGAR